MKPSEKPSSPRPREDEVKVIFLNRLRRLIRMRRVYREDLNPLGILLLERSIDATYQDCIDFGAGDQARELMGERAR